jgi:uncharacterized phage protein (TIGR02220 family)
MEEKEKPSYYAVIPATVRYDKDLKANEKLLYGEITSLTQKSGKCFASNSYFAELYGVAKETVSGWISNLEKKGYIKREIVYKEDTKQIINRYIKINEYPIDEKINTPIDEKINTPIHEKIKDNNTSNEYYKNNNNNIVEQVDEFASDTINEIISFLNEKAKSSYRSSTPKTRKLISARLKEKFVLEDFKKVIEFKCQQWLNDAKMSAYIRPETLFGTKFESYLNEANRGIVKVGSQVLGSQATYSDEYLEKFRRKRG